MGLKARVIATGEIVEINESSTIYDAADAAHALLEKYKKEEK